MTPAPPRPAPLITDDNEGFWSAATDNRLVGQRCVECQEFHHPPRPMCPKCHSVDHEWIELMGTGTLYSYAILHHPQHPAFAYPLIAALVELDEGIRLVSNLVDIEPAAVRIGMPLEVAFAPVDEGLKVPVFTPRGAR
jgi:uncharacterized OB-fold protein